MVERMALSTAFWSAARLEDGFFFYSIISIAIFFISGHFQIVPLASRLA
jgi:hypothetical protein